MKIKYSLIIMVLIILSSSFVYASDFEDNVEFMPGDFVFDYYDHNSSTYEGDIGLKMAYVNNTLNNDSYIIATEYLRGINYASGGTFKFDEAITCSHGPLRSDGMYVATKFAFKNGTDIPYLGIELNNLTNEQKKYFDNYEAQRLEYMSQQEQFAAEKAYSYSHMYNKYNSKSKYSYYYGSGGSGIIYTPNYY